MKTTHQGARAWAAGLLLSALCLAAAQAQDQPPDVPAPRPWNEKTWGPLRDKGPRPAAYLFTASYCSTCPEAFAALRQATQGSARQVELVAVWTDLAADQVLAHAAHFPGVTRFYAFDGFEPAIRQSVDPQWANITPYVVLVDRRGRLQRMLGTPPPEALKRWLE